MKKLKMVAGGLLCSLALVLSACGGGSDSGTTTTTTSTITGTLDDGAAALTVQGGSLVDDCIADTVIATDVDAATTTVDVDDNCAFSIELAVDTSYVLSFTDDDAFVATLVFDSGVDGFSGSTITLTSDTGDIALGTVTVDGSTATPENNPAETTDQDGDGTDDLSDTDDDDDGTTDDLETDCDLDGIIDDLDDSDCEADTASTGNVIAVRPVDGAVIDSGDTVKVKIDCVVDEDSLGLVSDGDTTGLITFARTGDGTDDTVIDCLSVGFEGLDTGDSTTVIRCNEGDFESGYTYTGTVSEGITCNDGTVEVTGGVTWSFSVSGEIGDDTGGDDIDTTDCDGDGTYDDADDDTSSCDEADDTGDDGDSSVTIDITSLEDTGLGLELDLSNSAYLNSLDEADLILGDFATLLPDCTLGLDCTQPNYLVVFQCTVGGGTDDAVQRVLCPMNEDIGIDTLANPSVPEGTQCDGYVDIEGLADAELTFEGSGGEGEGCQAVWVEVADDGLFKLSPVMQAMIDYSLDYVDWQEAQ